MNKQQEMQRYFDRAVRGVMKQGCVSANNGRCVYRGPNNTKCAIGHLISDKMYNAKTMENFNIKGLLLSNKVPIRWKRYKDLFVDLQSAHDSCIYEGNPKKFRKQFSRRCVNVAKQFNLNTKVLDEEYN